jgi:hypothetical protein
MAFVIFAILLIVCCLSLCEDRMQRHNGTIYIVLTVILVLLAGLREVGGDRDSENYEYYFSHCDDPTISSFAVEYSYLFLSRICRFIFNDVHSIFLLYAFVGVSLKMVAIHKLSRYWFLPVAMYLANYYVLHDLTQIRASIASGLFLFSIPFIGQGRRKMALGLLGLGCLFHYSALVLLPVVLLSNNDMGKRERLIWAALVPLGYLMYFLQFNVVTFFYIPYISDKIEIYESLRDKGLVGDEINVFYWAFLLKCLLYFCVLYFYDIIKKENEYLPLVLKLMGISIFIYLFFAQMPILSFRLSELFGIVEIIMFSYIIYMVRPQWVGRVIVICISLTLSYLYLVIEGILESM